MGAAIEKWLLKHETELIQTAEYLFEHPETAYKEELSSRYLADYLVGQGFRLSYGTAGIRTAFMAEWENGDPDGAVRPVIGFLLCESPSITARRKTLP